MTHITNVYSIPNVSVDGKCCMTNLPSNTAFRGFGAPQAMRIMEEIVDNVAHTLKMDPIRVSTGQEPMIGETLDA